jgi:hypothetical protein
MSELRSLLVEIADAMDTESADEAPLATSRV